MFSTSQILDAKAPSIYAYLLSNGFMPTTDKAHYALFKSPFRSERTASFKVDKVENLFYDYGTQDFGDFIAFYQLANGLNFKEAVTQILANSFSFQCQSNQHTPTTGKPEPAITLHKVKPLENKALLDYLQSRGINEWVAPQYCREVYYYINGKHYFAIGFPNDSGGYELRNKYFKGCIGKKDITFKKIVEHKNKLFIFEGFFDFMACITFCDLRGKPFDSDVIVLNSLTQLPKALPYFEAYDKIFCFFDNDKAGQSALQTLRASYIVNDCSGLYKGYKDMSEFMEKEGGTY